MRLNEQGKPGTANAVLDHKNSRIKIVNYNNELARDEVETLKCIAKAKNLDKIIVTAGEYSYRKYRRYGFQIEGTIEKFFRGEKAYLLSLFLQDERQQNPYSAEEDKVLLETEQYTSNMDTSRRDQIKIVTRTATTADAQELSQIFRKVFSTYPTQLHDPSYIAEIMNQHVLFKVCVIDDRIASVASAEIDWNHKNAEMTDCATLPEYRGLGLMDNLIDALETEMLTLDIPCVYSLARARSLGITMVFRNRGYQYRGRLVNNCHICGQYESMNIWEKQLNTTV
ncbi:putative beta-lysine N-acetyltransferase [Desulfuribacillus stibiiarsenatis]|uniref:Putative beta-lysine N-acetyltransferase n=1 Tax=Desulfuribacillus stibiiarsenatis TaxID=1390249 RepID=A0A1E5L5B2_9FIRM|nr:putative beta-lysine N-acetyltransferase [Desulfuribacillus stibiiarsenatis]OEH85193.1 putative beta-lysine N-acetyltransferase [Desulfuribacillus stibiiarsenatis]